MKFPSHPATRRRRAEDGAALIIVFWLIALLSLSVFTAVRVVHNDTRLMTTRDSSFQATLRAEMGLAVAANPVVEEIDTLLLNQTFYDGTEGFNVKLVGEGGRFNINALVQGAANNPADEELLENIFTYWGLTEEEARALVDALIDWVDDNGPLTEMEGAENEFYTELGFPNYPFDRPFYSLDEMRLVRGMDLAILLRPDWRNWFTIYSAGRLDVNEAEAELIAVAAGARDAEEDIELVEAARQVVELRWGADGIENTEDDEAARWRDLSLVFLELNVSAADQAVFGSRFTLSDTTTRIESIGWVGDFRKKIVVVVRNRSNRPQILVREEVPLF